LHTFLVIAFLISDDDNFKVLKAYLTATGRGRRPKLPKIELTNKLLVQVFLLKVSMHKSWKDVGELMSKIVPTLPTNRCRNLVQQAVHLVKDAKTAEAMRTALLTKHDLDYAGEKLALRGISRSQLLDPLSECWTELDKTLTITNEIMVELHKFQSKEKLTFPMMQQWLSLLTTDHNISDYKLKQKLKQLIATYTKAGKSKHKKTGEDAFNNLILI
jgi:hypothetical protein